MSNEARPHRTWRERGIRWRRQIRRHFNRLLSRLLGGTSKQRSAPLAPGTRRILVIRLNKRLGNILFLTPMLRSLAASLPQAQIDLLIQDRVHGELLRSLPGVGKIWIQENRLTALIALLRGIRRQRYDLVIDPTGNSSSNRIGMALSGGRQWLAFANDNQWLPLTHAAGSPASRHQALQAVELLSQGISAPRIERFDTLAVFPDDAARERAACLWEQTVPHATYETPVIGFFSRATGAKTLPAAWWRQWIAAIGETTPDASLIEILPNERAQPIDSNHPHIAIASLPQLAAFIARCTAFVAADSGPMHLAAAAGVPVIGLFRATSPLDYAPLGSDCVSLAGADLTPERCAEALAARVHRREPVKRRSADSLVDPTLIP